MGGWSERSWLGQSMSCIKRHGAVDELLSAELEVKEKWRERSHWRKRYEPAQTAYERLVDCPQLSGQERRELRDRFESFDPFKLKEEVERGLSKVLAAAEVAPSPSGGSRKGVDTQSRYFIGIESVNFVRSPVQR